MNEANRENTDLFIVDNSHLDLKALQYLAEWCDGLASSIDIATGYFEIGSLCALDGKWQNLDKIRILMGDEVMHRTRQAILDGIKAKQDALNASIEREKEGNEFLHGAAAIVEAIGKGQIECRAYTKKKFHAKAYITHAKKRVLGAMALVGSSNFTYPGLTDNVELNIQIQREVWLLQEWYEQHWGEAEDISEDILKVIEHHTKEYSPFQIFAKGLQEVCRGQASPVSEWETGGSDGEHSLMFAELNRYQQDAYQALLHIAKQFGGAFLCDGVGLGKTYVGLMLIERLVSKDRKRVVLFSPKGALDPVWRAKLRRYLSHIVNGFNPFMVFSHTDLHSQNPETQQALKNAREQADVVIIDEAHHFRNRGIKGTGKRRRSRYWEMYDLCEGKQVYMLTATPVNNQLRDLQHMIQLFSREDDAHFSSLGVQSLTGHFRKLEQALRKLVNEDNDLEDADVDTETNQEEAESVLASSPLFKTLVVQRSRKYVKESQKQQGGTQALFPEREPPRVGDYSLRKTYGDLLALLEKAFDKKRPLFTLAVYDPYSYYTGPKEDLLHPDIVMKVGRQKQVVSLIRVQFLKRFESSYRAFEVSCCKLLFKLLAFMHKYSIEESDKRLLARWEARNAEVLEFLQKRKHILLGEGDWAEEADDAEAGEDDLINSEMLDEVVDLDPLEKFDIRLILEETREDLNQLIEFIQALMELEPEHDDKRRELLELLQTDEVLKGHKALIFTEYLDTARYLESELKKAGIDGVARVDSSTGKDRGRVICAFSPYYNESSSAELAEAGEDEIRVLISTDVLSEGLNLQDATRLINYDLHWNPVRLMQRIGRVDRRLDEVVEQKLVEDHPEVESLRGTMVYWNFLPTPELDELLNLYGKVAHKVLRISKTLGIETGKLLTADDDYEALQNFNEAYEGQTSAQEMLQLEYQQLLKDNPDLEQQLNGLPGRVFSGRKPGEKGESAVFFCYALPAPDADSGGEWTIDAGQSQWFLYELEKAKAKKYAPRTHAPEIASHIRCEPDTPRHVALDEKTLVKARKAVEKHIKNKYLQAMNAPMGVKPKLVCWMGIAE